MIKRVDATLALGVVAGVAALAALAFAKTKLPQLAQDALNAVSPLNKGNVFYTGVNDLGASVSGDDSWNLGARLWEATHPAQVAAERRVTAPTWAQPGEAQPSIYDQPSGVFFP